MTRMPSAERRCQLTEAAIRAMTRDGVPRTTTRSIAAEAGVSLSVFHCCFDSKHALIESVIETVTQHSVTVVREAIRPKATLRETVPAGFQAYWNHVSAHPGEHMLTYQLTQYALREPGFAHPARRQYELYSDTYTELVEQLSREMDFALRVPALVLARYPAAMTDGLTLNFLVLGDDSAWAGVLGTITDHVAGLVREPDELPHGPWRPPVRGDHESAAPHRSVAMSGGGASPPWFPWLPCLPLLPRSSWLPRLPSRCRNPCASPCRRRACAGRRRCPNARSSAGRGAASGPVSCWRYGPGRSR